MVLRTARQGRNAGGKFWGCSTYPRCKATLPYESGESAPGEADDQPATPVRRRVAWYDGTLRRPGWKARYAAAGASLRSAHLPENASVLGTCWIASENLPSYQPADPDTRRVVGMMLKLLNRGTMPPLHPQSERRLLELGGLGDQVTNSPLPGDLSPRLRRPISIPAGAISVVSASPVALDVAGDSTAEDDFLAWLASVDPAARWAVPQASFDLLLTGAGREASADRRVDFLLHDATGAPIAVEVDGRQHEAQVLTDAERDRLLASIGIGTLRVPAAEASAGAGRALDALADRLGSDGEPDPMHPLLWGPLQVHRLLIALLESVQVGFLAGDRWVVEVNDPTELAVELVAPYLELLDALDRLWGSRGVAPATVVFKTGDAAETWRRFERQPDGRYVEVDVEPVALDVRIALECDRGAIEALPEMTDVPTVVVRTAFLPVDVRDTPVGGAERVVVRTEGDGTRAALRTILQAIFAKDDFRAGQFEAIAEVLEGRDCAVLLPTGAGKSLVYQLAGLCLPGRTLVVDPIVALIEDQIEGLKSNGIDRVVGITRDSIQQGSAEALLAQVAEADALFVLVAPERLQMQRFRSALREQANTTPINLAVIDEAHCVSEWGHSFRTSYLTLGDVLRRTCADPTGSAPPLLALTGTASRAVLRDVLYQLRIEQRTEHSIIRPATFDRPELAYRIIRTATSEDEATLRSAVRALPADFSESEQTFFQPNAESTFSGLVFTPTVKGRHGVTNAQQAIERLVPSARMYAGSAPIGYDASTWRDARRANASSFKANHSVALATTNAFGMGIDKANIRWVVHYGLPTSIESYYQEVGRAGRDGRPAQCILILSEFDADRNAQLLSEDLGLEEARARQSGVGVKAGDDVTTALWFQLQSFPGVDEEVDGLLAVVERLAPGREAGQIEMPFGGGEKEQDVRERALHRLIILGVVSDYLVEYGSKKFDVRLAGVTPEQVVDAFLSFVERTQPARLDVMRARVDGTYPKLVDAIEVCGRALVEFVYETIERSRRRSLREMYLAARECDTDAELRARVLAYLSEGDIGPVLEALAEERPFSFAPWISRWNEITGATDAREWRGSAGRLLTSYPDHPGLLFSRALVEALDPDGNLRELESNLEAGIRSASTAYGVTDTDLLGAVAWVKERCARQRPVAATAVAGAMVQSGVALPGLDALLMQAPADADPGIAVLRLANRLSEVAELAADLAAPYVEV